ncbi:iron chaperone [Dyadobacter aurulentus]|uniref:iron chaperone n=1 Tax=Dyadobacter sp. UC 10 TaxID=2605428 RepID=UPI0011F2D538|nr:DUF1801 domain-containing protein [Dyadobacter sp. UC 10]KAA0988935.1 DUF1801 domain-containing protein [Dyadobacter sp. UC 10]
MAKTDYKSIDEYHSVFSGDTAQRMQQIRQAVHQIVPDVQEMISYQIPCFKYKGYLIYYSAYTNHISLSYPFSDQLLANFKEDLKQYKVSKSAIQFPNNEPLPMDLITGIIRFRKSENEMAAEKGKK